MLVDIAKIKVKAGDGGKGRVSFLHTKSVAKGGPDGGNGGNGGAVYFVASHNLATLMDFRSKDFYKAGGGEPGGKKNMTGAGGEDIEIRVPVGTLIYELQDGKELLVGDLVAHGQRLLIACGGRGGRGNTSYKGSTNRTPRQFTLGTKGECKEVKLEVKLIADVGLIGFPNAGKSTLINKLTSSKAKVGSYPFTTLTPNLGVCVLPNGKEAVIADIPGLIEGASEGKGLGDEFLRHIERTRVLVHMIDPSFACFPRVSDIGAVVYARYEAIRKELGSYSQTLLGKEEIVVINKIDITEIADAFGEIEKVFAEKGIVVTGISGVTGAGTDVLKERLMEGFERASQEPHFEVKTPVKVYTIDNLPNKRLVFREPLVKKK